jgi:phenylpropionate dioxygenase-like ring-hydroxylating dioxygenase large terminal subunit
MDLKNIKLYVDDRPEEKVFRVHRDVFADPALFELEMKYIFERSWIFLGLESQIAKANDYFTATIGRTPVVVTRTPKGQIGAFINACRHKGATVARLEAGNARYHVCPYHGWAYDAAGKNVDIKDRAAGCYAGAFDEENHDLLPIGRVASYKGLIFGCLDPDVMPLEDFLGDLRFFLDVAMEQGPQGMEFIPGRMKYSFRANWKLQLDNGVDPYHLTSTHVSFMELQGRRRKGEGHVEAQQFDWLVRAGVGGGHFNFRHGHTVLWRHHPSPAETQKRPIFPVIDEIRSRVGDTRAEWMLMPRSLVLFPNFQIADTQVLMLRQFNPLSVNLTEMKTWCLAPIGEREDLRARRLRQYEDFFNPAGMATPDDTVTYEDCQRGFETREGLEWLQGYSRAIGELKPGANETARAIGIQPVHCSDGPIEQSPETCLHAPYREWARVMQAGVSGEKAW